MPQYGHWTREGALTGTTIAAVVVGLAVIVLVHEWGHLLAARAVGVRVNELALGFGPVLVSLRGGGGWRVVPQDSDRGGARGTLYSLRLLPLGGYVSLAGLGEERPSLAQVRQLDPDDYRAQSPGRKALIIAGGPVANVVLAVVLGGAAVIGVALGGRAGADPVRAVSGRPRAELSGPSASSRRS